MRKLGANNHADLYATSIQSKMPRGHSGNACFLFLLVLFFFLASQIRKKKSTSSPLAEHTKMRYTHENGVRCEKVIYRNILAHASAGL